MSRARAAPARRHAGQWILLDAHLRLLAIGDDLYAATSPLPRLDLIARRVLLPQMRLATGDHRPRTQILADRGKRWSVRVVPLVGPRTGQLVAVLGAYWPADAPAPVPPHVGGWEWLVTAPGSDQYMRVYWTPEMFAVHDISVPAGAGPHFWEGPQWLDEIVVEPDRIETWQVHEELFTAPTDAPKFHVLRVRSAQSAREHLIRLAGRRDVAMLGPEIRLHGVAMRVEELTADKVLRTGTSAFQQAMATLLAHPLCVIETTYEQLLFTIRFGDLPGLALPAHRHLPRMCHPDDLPALRSMLRHAAAHPSTPTAPVLVRFAAVSGGWMMVELVGVGLRLSGSAARHVLCRVIAVTAPVGEPTV